MAQIIAFPAARIVRRQYQIEAQDKVAQLIQDAQPAPAETAYDPEYAGLFQVGCTYYGRHVCDSESVFEFTVVARTKARATIENVRGERKTVKVFEDGNHEYLYPYGRYSMAAILSAEKVR